MKSISISSTSVIPDLEVAQAYNVNVGANMTVSDPANASAGDRMVLKFNQGDDYTLSFGGQYEFAGGVQPVLGTTGGDFLFLEFLVFGGKVWEVARVAKTA